MRKAWVVFVAVWLSLGIIALTLGYIDTVYKLEVAVGYLSRAKSAGFAEDMIRYIDDALLHLPNSGNPVWLFPTERTDFSLIRSDLESIRERLAIISRIDRASPAYAQGLSDIRGKLTTVISQIGEAMPYTLVTPINIALATAWLSIPYVTYKIVHIYNNRKQASAK